MAAKDSSVTLVSLLIYETTLSPTDISMHKIIVPRILFVSTQTRFTILCVFVSVFVHSINQPQDNCSPDING
jgi:hypothetical protein